MWDLFHHVEDELTERPQAEEVGAWRQRWWVFEHPRDIIVDDEVIHVVGWDVVFVLTRTVDALKEETN